MTSYQTKKQKTMTNVIKLQILANVLAEKDIAARNGIIQATIVKKMNIEHFQQAKEEVNPL